MSFSFRWKQLFFFLVQEEQSRFQEQVEAVEKKASSLQGPQNPLAVPDQGDSAQTLDSRERQALEYVIADSLNSLKRNLCEVVESWNNRYDEFLALHLRTCCRLTFLCEVNGICPTANNREHVNVCPTKYMSVFVLQGTCQCLSNRVHISVCPTGYMSVFVLQGTCQCLSNRVHVSGCPTRYMSMFVQQGTCRCLSYKVHDNVCPTGFMSMFSPTIPSL